MRRSAISIVKGASRSVIVDSVIIRSSVIIRRNRRVSIFVLMIYSTESFHKVELKLLGEVILSIKLI